VNQHDLEAIYETLAEAIDAVGEEQALVYLAKVALALAEATDDPSLALSLIRECKSDLAG